MINPMISDIFIKCGFEPVVMEHPNSKFIQLRQTEPTGEEFRINLCSDTVGDTIDKIKEIYNGSDNEDSELSSEWRKEKMRELVEDIVQLEVWDHFRVSPVYVSEMDFDEIFKELPESISLEDDEGIDPYFDDRDKTMDWQFTTNSHLSELLVERSGYNVAELKDFCGDDYIEGLNPILYDDVYPEFYLIIDENKRIFIETMVRIDGNDICDCGRTVFSKEESATFYKYINKYLMKFNGKTIDEYLQELKDYSSSMNKTDSEP